MLSRIAGLAGYVKLCHRRCPSLGLSWEPVSPSLRLENEVQVSEGHRIHRGTMAGQWDGDRATTVELEPSLLRGQGQDQALQGTAVQVEVHRAMSGDLEP